MRKIILFDIDYTLFDTELFREKLYKEIQNALCSLGIDSKTLAKAQQEAILEVREKAGYFNPKQFSLLLAKKLKLDKAEIIIEDAIFTKANFRNNYYNEVKAVLKKLGNSVKFGIFSKGHQVLQREKLREIKHLFAADDINIAINKYTVLPDIIKKYNNFKIYIVDDTLNVLYEAKKISSNIYTVWVKRGIYAKNQKPIKNFVPDASIEDLRELISIVISERN